MFLSLTTFYIHSRRLLFTLCLRLCHIYKYGGFGIFSWKERSQKIILPLYRAYYNAYRYPLSLPIAHSYMHFGRLSSACTRNRSAIYSIAKQRTLATLICMYIFHSSFIYVRDSSTIVIAETSAYTSRKVGIKRVEKYSKYSIYFIMIMLLFTIIRSGYKSIRSTLIICLPKRTKFSKPNLPSHDRLKICLGNLPTQTDVNLEIFFEKFQKTVRICVIS